MKKIVLNGILLTCVIVCICLPELSAETVFMKDGSLVHGRIINNSASAVNIRTENGKNITLRNINILRINYGVIFLGKQYLQMTSGETVECFIVDEDQNTYTLRKDLQKPAELIIEKTKVLYIVRNNPRELKGSVDGRSIILKWIKPVVKVLRYNIYTAVDGGKYNASPLAVTENTSYTLDGIAIGHRYAVKVTAVTSGGEETLPSNECVFNMKSLPPPSVACRVTDSGDGSITAGISWKKPSEGESSGYVVYKKNDFSYEKAGTTSDTFFNVQNLDPETITYFQVRTLSRGNEESEPGNTVSTRGFNDWYIIFSAGGIIPSGYLGTVLGPGAGCSFILSNALDSFLHYGISVSLNAFTSGCDRIKGYYSAPVSLEGGINARVSRNFIIEPFVAAGYSFGALRYLETGYTVDPVFTGGIRVPLRYGFFITPFVSYSWIPDRNEHLGYITVGIGAAI